MRAEELLDHMRRGAIQLFPDGEDRYNVFTPFHFDDGDHFVIVLRKQDGDRWCFTDEGHTYLHISCDVDLDALDRGRPAKMIDEALGKYQVEDRGGRLVAPIEEIAQAGTRLFQFIQCLLEIVHAQKYVQKG